jgi:hypothetical protein
MYSITEIIYYSQLSSVAILLQPEPNCFTSYNTRKGWVLSPYVLSPCGLLLPSTCLLVTVNEARSYFAFTITSVLVVLGGLVVIVLVIWSKVRGFKPGRGQLIFKGDKNP